MPLSGGGIPEAMPESPDTQNRLYAVQEDTRRELAAEFQITESRPQGLILPNVEVRSPTFESVLPELLNYSQRARLVELRSAVAQLTASADRLLAATEGASRTSEQLRDTTRRLLYAGLGTLGVALVTLGIAVLQVVR
jgi:hypothetical protein